MEKPNSQGKIAIQRRYNNRISFIAFFERIYRGKVQKKTKKLMGVELVKKKVVFLQPQTKKTMSNGVMVALQFLVLSV